MPIGEEKHAALTRWTREKLLPYLAVFLLLVLCTILGKSLLDTRKQVRDQEARLEAQRATIAQLQKEPEDSGLIHEGKPIITGDTIREQFSDLGELVAIEYIYTNADQYENQNQVTVFKWEVDVPFTAKSFLLSYDGRIKAGVALSNVQVNINDNAHTITVTLPPAEITSHEIFEDNIRVFNEKDGIFNRITVENYADFISGQKTVMEQRAIDLGLLTSADKNAQTVLRSLLSSLPGMEDYRLTITTRR
ncbi:MAG: DUF4230 domain-containing protein [Oscillospiraceae bacterium]|jgi:hypothetical protein|nr:DUF4230 domain-containing protein [Oscillospiraceae bacterium]